MTDMGNGPADALDLAFPFTGRWLVQNSPANKVPSHGTELFASKFAIDFVPVNERNRSAKMTLRGFLAPEKPEHFVGFGRPILSPCTGRVIAVVDDVIDHAAYRGIPSLSYALTQRERVARGWREVAGNLILIQAERTVVALCHLKFGSSLVRVGQELREGEAIAACGNTGNSTEPHLHLQAFDQVPVEAAQAVPVQFEGAVPRNGAVVVL